MALFLTSWLLHLKCTDLSENFKSISERKEDTLPRTNPLKQLTLEIQFNLQHEHDHVIMNLQATSCTTIHLRSTELAVSDLKHRAVKSYKL